MMGVAAGDQIGPRRAIENDRAIAGAGGANMRCIAIDDADGAAAAVMNSRAARAGRVGLQPVSFCCAQCAVIEDIQRGAGCYSNRVRTVRVTTDRCQHGCVRGRAAQVDHVGAGEGDVGVLCSSVHPVSAGRGNRRVVDRDICCVAGATGAALHR